MSYPGALSGTTWVTTSGSGIHIADTIMVTQTTSVILIDSQIYNSLVYTGITYTYNDVVVVLDSVSPPGRIVTIRDTAGFLSHNIRIVLVTNTGVNFLDTNFLGINTPAYYMTQPYSYLTVTCRDPNTWALQNSFAFEANSVVPVSLLGITAQYMLTSSIFTNIISTGVLNVSTIYLNSLYVNKVINVSTLNAN